MTTERLIYLPLGGAGEIGMNAYVYGYGTPENETLIVVDLGVTFSDMDTSPGVDLIWADMSWLIARKDRIAGIFITHAHEDHVGAVGHTYAQLGAPIYARAFTAHIARGKLAEHGAGDDTVTVCNAWPETTQAGPFRVGFAPVSHSVPESSGLVIDSPAGRVVHTGDFKLDSNPLVGEPWDPDLWADIAKDGVKALVCDSTNVFSPHAGRSESTLPEPITELVSGAKGMVVATTFASNVARVRTLAMAGQKAGRSICLMGRAMRRMIEAGIKTGVLADFPPTISPEDALDLPRDQVMLLATGSQGERRAASAQLAGGKYLGHKLQDVDMFLFSSKTIPGNERGVIRIMNQLSEKGVDVVDESMGDYHVSGHANRPDLLAVHDIIKPQMLIPMHGEHRHLREHARLASENGIKSAVVVNGMMMDLSGDQPKVAGYVDTGRTYLNGKVQIGAMDGVVRDRIRMALNGHVIVTAIVDEEDGAHEVWCDLMGLPEVGISGKPFLEVLEDQLVNFLSRAKSGTLRDDARLENELHKAARRIGLQEIGKKPEATIVISRLM